LTRVLITVAAVHDTSAALINDLDEEAQKLRRCVENTAVLMGERGIQTLDDLTSRIDNGVFDESANITSQTR